MAATAIAGLVAVGAVALAAPSWAVGSGGTTAVTAAQGQADESAELRRQRAAVACARIPNVVTRTGNLQERLAGDEGTRGSLAWLADRAEEAEARGRADLAEALRTRLEVRTELADLLPLRLEALQSAQELCDGAGL
jgi:hypothetical protein